MANTPKKNKIKGGQTLVEYALLIALIAVAMVGALTAFNTAANDSFGDSNSELIKAFGQ